MISSPILTSIHCLFRRQSSAYRTWFLSLWTWFPYWFGRAFQAYFDINSLPIWASFTSYLDFNLIRDLRDLRDFSVSSDLILLLIWTWFVSLFDAIYCLFGCDFTVYLDVNSLPFRHRSSSSLDVDLLPIWTSILFLFGCRFTAYLDANPLPIQTSILCLFSYRFSTYSDAISLSI
jgi:hypothetical protein